MSPPAISVVIPCHNAEPYLAQAIGSALEQRRPPLEVIVVDDASTDDSLALARRFQAADPRVRVFAERLARASRARNLGALASAGDAILFLDADDVLGPDALEALAAALAAQPDGVAVCPWFRLARHDGRWRRRPPSCAPRLPGQSALGAWLQGWYHPPCAVLWSRAAFERAGRWDELTVVNDDGDLMMRALAQGVPFVETPHGAAFYRRLPDGQLSQSSGQHSREGTRMRLRVLIKIACLLEQAGGAQAERAALRAAFHQIAAGEAARHPDLAARARVWARRYRPARRRWSWRPGGRGPSVSAPARPVEDEVRYGLELAGRVRQAPAPTLLPAPGRVERPCVSVIVPTYNRAHLLGRAVASVLRQTFRDFELLIVDDGSTDATREVVAGIADPRLRYLRQPRNGGVAAARNRGLREARGEFLAFLDSDDEWLPEKLARQVARFADLPESVGLLYTGLEHVRADGTTRIECTGARGDVYRDMLRVNVIHGGGSNVMVRRAVVAAVGFFHEGLSAIEDYEYWLRIARLFEVEVIEEPLIRYHDLEADGRRSQALQQNLEARWWFYRRHRAEMRRAGVAHLFLLKSARWALTARQPDLRAARRLAARAVFEAPTSRTALAAFGRTMLRRT